MKKTTKSMKKALKSTICAKKLLKSSIFKEKPLKSVEIDEITQFLGLSVISTIKQIQIPNGTVYYNDLIKEYQLKGINGQTALFFNLDKYAETKNSPFLLFMAEFNGMVREEKEKRLKVSWQAIRPTSSTATISMNSTYLRRYAPTIKNITV